jgi:6-phosphofructokinase 1
MGRNCGYLGLMAGIAGGAEVIVIPEKDITPPEIAERLRDAYLRGKTHSIVVVAEGAKYDAQAIARHFEDHKAEIGFVVRVTILGHVVRGASPTASDRLLATRSGVAAVKALAEGRHGVLIGVQKGTVTETSLDEVAATKKPLDLEFIELARILAQ